MQKFVSPGQPTDPPDPSDPPGLAGLSARERGARLDPLAGGGHMGTMIREKDWSQTPLGAREHWPQSLRTALSICLCSRFPMLLWWGRELCMLYNDAYVPFLGKKHPGALGQRGIEVWGEIWDVIGPQLAGVLARGEASWSSDQLLVMDRKGYLEETYFTWSYSPIAEESGGIGGVFTAVTETTARVLGERRMRTLRQLGEQVGDARTVGDACGLIARMLRQNDADVPFALIYLLSEDGRTAHFCAGSGLGSDHPAAPEVIQLASAGWPIEEALRRNAAISVEDLGERFGPVPGGCWPEPASVAQVLPIARAGSARAHGVLIVGVNPRRELDEDYQSFFKLLATQVASVLDSAKAYEEERRRAEALAELDRLKTVFFSNISHEFRTPLTLMLGPAEDLRAGAAGPLTAAQRQMVDTLRRNSLRLLKLVNNLLDFARLEAGRARAAYEPTDLAALTADLASTFRSAVERAGLGYVVDCASLPEPIYVDRDLWEKIVLNLLSNALKFTFEGTIEVALRWCGDHVELAVRDTGTGIPRQELPHLFARFHRVMGVQARTQEGSGIGLALVHELVKLHGGTIEVQSELGAGTAFRVSIPTGCAHLPQQQIKTERSLVSTALGAAPFVQEALRWLPETGSSDDALPALDITERSGQGDAEPGRILLADDNADMRDYVRRILAQRWSVEAVADGQAALDAARASVPDLIVADVMMPRLDGFGLLRALRADPRLRAIPIVLISARAGEESRSEGVEAGADDYLTKPFSARELLARVQTHLDLARLRSRAASERERLLSEVQRSEARLRKIFDTVVIGTTLWTLDDQFIDANELFLEITGYSREDLRRGLGWRMLAPPEYSEVLERSMQELKERGANRPFEIEIVRKDGRRVPVLAGASMLDERTGVGFVQDISDRKVVERERAVLLERAEAASRAKDEFLAMLGHELRNPLAPITTALQLMRMRGGGKLEKEQVIIERQVRHLTRLVDDLLDVARIARGKVELKKERLELWEAVSKALEMTSVLLEQRRHHLDVEVEKTGLGVDADPTRLAQVISNLLNNAAKYTEPGGRIRLAAAKEGSEVVLRVRDNGIGISAEMLPRVFDLFVQERQALDRAQGGLGLGLSIVRSLIAQHGGSVTVHSDGLGLGSELTIRLPAASVAKAPLLPADPGTTERVSTAHRILVVDDNEDVAHLIAEVLTKTGYTVRVAYDGLSALRIAEELGPELALLDIGLPVMDGYELAARLRAASIPKALRLVAVTGYGQESHRRRVAEVGFDVHLIKPVEPEQILTVVRALLAPRSGEGRAAT